MTALIGDTIEARYVKHAAPGAGAPLTNGTTLDAGTAQIIDSNISWLSYESCRHLVSMPGFSVATVASTSKVYDGIVGFSAPATTYVSSMEIPWDRRTAVRLGPFNAVQDEVVTASTERTARKFKVVVDLTNTGSTLTMYYAATLTPDADNLYLHGGIVIDGSANVLVRNAAVATGQDVATLTPQHDLSANVQNWKCRNGATLTSSTTYVVPLWLWVGFRAVGGTVWINRIDAFEVR